MPVDHYRLVPIRGDVLDAAKVEETVAGTDGVLTRS
jgi:hypothetical protein